MLVWVLLFSELITTALIGTYVLVVDGYLHSRVYGISFVMWQCHTHEIAWVSPWKLK